MSAEGGQDKRAADAERPAKQNFLFSNLRSRAFMIMRKEIKLSIPPKLQPYNFDYFLTHYVFQPWVVEEDKLVRLFKLESGKFVLVRVGFTGEHQPVLKITLLSNAELIPKEER